MENTTDHPAPADRRPLGFWLRAVDGLISREFAAAFDDEPVSRRDWMILNALDGDVDEALSQRVRDRMARHPKRIVHLAELGWIAASDGQWTLTDAGRAAKHRLAEKVDAVRERVAGAVPAQDLATTLRTLEAIARRLGGDDEALRFGARGPRRHGFGHDRGHRGHRFGEHPRHGHHGHGFGRHEFGTHVGRSC
ncbi:hypothetical protein [Microbacterium sp. NPDC096154]|uniref:hypothetical protein n=1 Tax=Microbacterium sp. NPDC096154 TaxID=3155549 RepID=UPI00332F9767